MRFIAAKNLKPGMLVGKNFYNNSMCIMLRKGVLLNSSLIKTINRVNIAGLYIDDELTSDIVLKPLIDDDLKLEFATEVRSIFSSVQTVVKPVTGHMDNIVKSIIDQISSKPNYMVNMHELKLFDNYTFQHSINVCILSTVLGHAQKLSDNQINNLALAAVYHDIGKMFIDQRIINKPGPLTDEERAIVKKHPLLGIEYLRKLDMKRSDVLEGVFRHHERFDGMGYPSGLAGENIGIFGKIIALTDVFDAITSNRAYLTALLPSEAVEYIMANAGQHFDPELTQLFVNNISAYPIGVTVRLSNGLVGVVAENYTGYTMRPLVKILPGDPKERPYFINLRGDPAAKSVTIVGVIS
ncbi:MAG: HD-GYP domain-containing protein [Clostridiales bacterium]|jgi:putative nucleotidyltransferase with HDIG domain|nr:HD-GYP domain-containing protein [Clostridiales bacterium]